ncbi:DNRLRE domain-containing protein [Xanthomarina sp. GH4-25]|uniref:DNRLRE domain-containing protein n=1 Tax=Xanthomarina sp. GH4-25 TaxID=3349335 RepID=UPI00387822CA
MLRIKETAPIGNNTRRGLLKFDVSALNGTANRLVVDATLMMNASVSSGPIDVSFYDIDNTWSESTVTYNNAPSFTTLLSASTTTFNEDSADDDNDGDSNELIHGGADVTEFIKDEYNLGTATISLGLKSETIGSPQFKPTTKDHSTDFALRPYIVASYLEAPVVAADPPTTKLAKLTFETDPLTPDPNSSVTDIAYTVDKAEFSDGERDYFIRTDGSDTNSVYTYTSNVDLGDYYFTAQDIDDNTGLPADEVAIMTLDRIDISGYENLELRVYLAQIGGQNSGWDNSEAETGENDWLHFNYNIHNGTPGAFNNLLWIESEGVMFDPVNGNRNNKDAGIDLDFDGEAERTPATQFGSTFKQFTVEISGTGEYLDIVLDFNINGNHEDIAIDNIEIWGTLINATCSGTNITWDGTDWSNGTGPDITTPTVINGDYSALEDGGSFSACSLTVNGTLTIEDNFYVEIEHDALINGDLIIEDGGSLVQNVDTGIYKNSETGESKFIKSTDILENWYDYTYWSSPMSNLTIATSPLTISDRSFWYDANNYLDVLIEDANTNTFTPGSDDIDDNGDDWQWTTGSTPMIPGTGFAASHSSSGFTSGIAYDYEFVGEFNNGEITASIVYDPLNTGGHWNLLGNPYPSAIDFDAFITNNPGVVDGLVYLWSQATDPIETASGNELINFNNADYIMMNTGSGSVNNSPNTLLEYIPSGQSFFIAGLSNANVTFNNSMRIKDGGSNGQFFKTSNSKKTENTEANKIWLNLLTDAGGFNQILVAYVEGATNDFDGSSYDAPRLTSNVPAIIYTQIAGIENEFFAIQGKDVNSINEDEIIPIGFSTSIESPTVYSLSIQHLIGDFLTSNTIYLKDNLLSTIHNISASDYSFTSDIGEFNNRFEILFNNNALSVETFQETSNELQIINLDNDRINFKAAQNLTINKIIIYDVLGRQIYRLNGENNSETYSLSKLSDAVYIAKVELSNNTIITKKFINY